MTPVYGRMLFYVRHILPGWRLTRQRNLALLTIGIRGERDLTGEPLQSTGPATTGQPSAHILLGDAEFRKLVEPGHSHSTCMAQAVEELLTS